jgi:hypothetical protein
LHKSVKKLWAEFSIVSDEKDESFLGRFNLASSNENIGNLKVTNKIEKWYKS